MDKKTKIIVSFVAVSILLVGLPVASAAVPIDDVIPGSAAATPIQDSNGRLSSVEVKYCIEGELPSSTNVSTNIYLKSANSVIKRLKSYKGFPGKCSDPRTLTTENSAYRWKNNLGKAGFYGLRIESSQSGRVIARIDSPTTYLEVPLIGQSSSTKPSTSSSPTKKSTGPKYSPEVVNCLSIAMGTRDEEIMNTVATYAADWDEAVAARRNAQLTAWEIPSRKDRRTALKTSYNNYRSAVKEAKNAMRQRQRNAWTNFYAARDACSPDANKEDKTTDKVDTLVFNSFLPRIVSFAKAVVVGDGGVETSTPSATSGTSASTTQPTKKQAPKKSKPVTPAKVQTPDFTPEAISCMKGAIEARDGAIITAIQAYGVAWQQAIQRRMSNIGTAWGIENAKERRAAIKAAWTQYRADTKTAKNTLRQQQRDAWASFYITRDGCSPNAQNEDKTSEKVDTTASILDALRNILYNLGLR